MTNIEELELHIKMINYYVDLINENKNISNLKMLLQEIETLHNIILKEYINHLSIALNTVSLKAKIFRSKQCQIKTLTQYMLR